MVRVVPWQALNLVHLGQTAEARAQLARVVDLTPAPDAWVAKLCEYLSDMITEQDLLTAAAELGDAGKAARLCEGRYFIGQKRLLATDAEAAARHFREALAGKTIVPAPAMPGSTPPFPKPV